MKSYTDIEQSKKLAEILPLESADMCYDGYALDNNGSHPVRFHKPDGEYDIPCWSLAALFGIIPKHITNYNVLRIDISDNDFAIWYDEIGYGVNNDLPNITMESAVDACYEMVCWLKENRKI